MQRLRQLNLPTDRIVDLCRKYGVSELAVFGSALRENFSAASDIDFLVAFENNDTGPWMCKLTELEEELSSLLARKVDLVNKRGVEQSPNWIRRKAILGPAEVIYGS